MEGLAPPHQVLLRVRFGIESGEATRSILERIVQEEDGRMRAEVLAVLVAFSKGTNLAELRTSSPSNYRRALQELLLSGLRGEPILDSLKELEQEIARAAEAEIDEFMGKLPIQLTVVMLLFNVPGVMLLLLWPIFSEILRGLQ